MDLHADAYRNFVRDKIVAYPKGAQFRWTMLNLGRVRIIGIDLTGSLTLNPLRDLYITGKLQYTYQEAIDVTSPADTYYRDQIPTYLAQRLGHRSGNMALMEP